MATVNNSVETNSEKYIQQNRLKFQSLPEKVETGIKFRLVCANCTNVSCWIFYQSEHKGDLDERKAILAEIERQETMLSNARKQIASNEIEADDFKAIKADCNKLLKLIEDKLENLPSKSESEKTIENLLVILVAKFSNIQMHFKRSSVVEKRKLIGSMYPKTCVLME